MKRLLLLVLAAVPLFAASVTFIYNDYDYYEGDYWYDEYWEDNYWCDGYWVYYPHGYYCVHYVWWYPWWWDWYWYRCHWHHHFHWDFFYSGFYVVWYESGCWWFRPRYGRWVRYKVPHSYYELRYRAKQHGIVLPSKPPRELNIPYKESAVRELIKQKDPDGFSRIEKEHKSGNLEKMRKEYVAQTEKKIAVKNEEYKKYDDNKKTQLKTNEDKKYNYPTNKRIDYKPTQKSKSKYTNEEHNYNRKSESHIIKRPKNESKSRSKAPPAYYYDDEKKTNKKQGKTERPRKNDYEKKEKSSQKGDYKKSSPQKKSKYSNEKQSKEYHKPGTYNKKR